MIEARYEAVTEPPWPDDAAIRGRPRAVESRYETVSLDRFLAEPEPECPMLVAGLGLPSVGTIVLGGPPKSLKTLFMTQLALCTSSLDDEDDWLPFLDFPIERGGPVVFVEEEGGRSPLRRRIDRQREALGAKPSIEFLLFAGVRIDNDASMARLTQTAIHHDAALVVLDPFSFLHSQDENKPASMAPVMKRLSRLASDAETLVVAIHHVTKPQADRPKGRLGDRIRGASSITAGVDGFLLLDRIGDNRAKLDGEFRDHEPISLAVELDPATLLLHRVDEPTRRSVPSEDLRAFVAERGHVTRAQVTEHFGLGSKNTARVLLEELDGIDWHRGPAAVEAFFRRIYAAPQRYGWRWRDRWVSAQGPWASFVAIGDEFVDVAGVERRVIPYCLTGTLVQHDGRWRFLLLHGSEESSGG
jgi:hypothetical protein